MLILQFYCLLRSMIFKANIAKATEDWKQEEGKTVTQIAKWVQPGREEKRCVLREEGYT